MIYFFDNKRNGDVDYSLQILPIFGRFSYFENFNNWITIDLNRSLFGIVVGKKYYFTNKADKHLFRIFQLFYFNITF